MLVSMMNKLNPTLVEVTRGGAVESRHLGACVIMDADGKTLHSIGDAKRLVFPRSAIKPVQALPLIETGAADHFGVTDEELALACASHNGEAEHVSRVRAWLNRMGLGQDDFACGVHNSLNIDVALDLARSGEENSRAHNNCSGKHTGFLCTAAFMKEPLDGYVKRDHPVQKRVAAAMEAMADVRLSDGACGVDGCGIPACSMPLEAIARAMARMTKPDHLAAKRIVHAMASHPALVAGTGRSDTQIMAACGGRLVTKIGAEGVHIAIVPERGIGIALKIDDGNARASDVAMTNVLDALGLLDDAAKSALADLLVTPLVNTLGETVGSIRPASALRF